MLTTSYNCIQDFYGDKRSKRSNVPYINHIDEGLIILQRINAGLNAQAAYCLHPMFQSDKDLTELYEYGRMRNIDRAVILLAMEYRNVANRGLSCYQVDDPDKIYLSPLKDVNDMLIADKVQNRKDFLKYHVDTHPKSIELDIYFKNWLRALKVTEAQYHLLIVGL